MKTEFDNKLRILRLAETFAGNLADDKYPCSTKCALFRAVKDENAGRNEALFVVASIAANKSIDSFSSAHRAAVEGIDSLFDSLACEFMGYDDFINLAAEIAETFSDRFHIIDILNMFDCFSDNQSIEEVCA